MKLAGIYTNYEKDPDCVHTGMLVKKLAEKGARVVVPPETFRKLSQNSNVREGDILDGVDSVICLGGDGTFLKVARMAYRARIPILGINLGSMGFLTDIEKKEISYAVDSITSGDYKIEERMMLDMEIVRQGEVFASDVALNDVVITRGAISRIIHIKTYINGTYVDIFPGDGLIVSTPTGSTAYSLSAGGPIAEPDTEMIIITPICPHLLYTRSIVTDASRVIKAVVKERTDNNAMVTVDGQKAYKIHGEDTVIIKNSGWKTRVIKYKPNNFFDVLRRKIYYRGEDFLNEV